MGKCLYEETLTEKEGSYFLENIIVTPACPSSG